MKICLYIFQILFAQYMYYIFSSPAQGLRELFSSMDMLTFQISKNCSLKPNLPLMILQIYTITVDFTQKKLNFDI